MCLSLLVGGGVAWLILGWVCAIVMGELGKPTCERSGDGAAKSGSGTEL